MRDIVVKKGNGSNNIISLWWVVIALLLTLPMPFDAKAQQTHEFKMAQAEAIGSPITNAFEKWGEILEKRSTDGLKSNIFRQKGRVGQRYGPHSAAICFSPDSCDHPIGKF